MLSTLALVILVLLILAIAGGFYGSNRYSAYGHWNWSPVGLIVIVLLLLFLTGRL
jgi:hypothetical protein